MSGIRITNWSLVWVLAIVICAPWQKAPAKGALASTVLRSCRHKTVRPAGSNDVPAAPSNCEATSAIVFGRVAAVSWTDNSDNEDGFVVEWRQHDTVETNVVPANSTGTY